MSLDFQEALRSAGWARLTRGRLRVLQLNLGRLCNMSCRHCHVEAGPDRGEQMGAEVAQACIRLMERLRPEVVDLSGGAPELNPHFRALVQAAVDLGQHVIDRNNLSILLLPRFADLPAWLGERAVEVNASLPGVRASITDAWRGENAFERSIEGIRRLNEAGYGQGDPRRVLTLVHNPGGAFLPAGQAALERDWRRTLEREHGVRFDRLIALNNLAVGRFGQWLDAKGQRRDYEEKLGRAFNPATVAGLMCRDTLSVDWEGRLHDCDFNAVQGLGMLRPSTVFDLGEALEGREIRTGTHCFGCTAGAGSSCGGATA